MCVRAYVRVRVCVWERENERKVRGETSLWRCIQMLEIRLPLCWEAKHVGYFMFALERNTGVVASLAPHLLSRRALPCWSVFPATTPGRCEGQTSLGRCFQMVEMSIGLAPDPIFLYP